MGAALRSVEGLVPVNTLYFVPLDQLTETEGTFFGFPTGTIFPTGETFNTSAPLSGFGFQPATLQITGTPEQIQVNDDDGTFDDDGDTFSGGASQTLAQPWETFPAGTDVETQYGYILSGDDGSARTIYVVNFMPNQLDDTVEGIVSNFPLDPAVTYTVTSGFSIADVDYADLAICFGEGTLIETPGGQQPVETLRQGDLVQTSDHGPQPLLWVGRSQHLLALDDDKMAPYIVSAGTFGPSQPSSKLVLSPQHRILIKSPVAARMYGTDEVLVRVKDLEAFPGIRRDHQIRVVRYFHLLFEGHMIVQANGLRTESLLLGPQACKAVPQTMLADLFSRLPHLQEHAATPARRCEQGRRARHFATRVAKRKERHGSNAA